MLEHDSEGFGPEPMDQLEVPPTDPGNAACDAGLGRTSLDFQSVEFRRRLLEFRR